MRNVTNIKDQSLYLSLQKKEQESKNISLFNEDSIGRSYLVDQVKAKKRTNIKEEDKTHIVIK